MARQLVPVDPEEVIINPATGLVETDETARVAIKNGFYYICRSGRGTIQWSRMRPCYTADYTKIPRDFGLTEAEAQTMMKMAHERMVPLDYIGKLWGKKYEWVMRFIMAKKIPLFKEPLSPYSVYVFSGDVVRAIESCKLDMEKDGGFWPRWMIKKKEADKRQRRKERRDAEAKKAAESERGTPAVQDHASVLAGTQG